MIPRLENVPDFGIFDQETTPEWAGRLRHAREIVAESLREAQEANKQRYDEKARPKEYREGDMVMLVRPPSRNVQLPRKLLPRCIGPFRIHKVLDRTAELKWVKHPHEPIIKAKLDDLTQIPPGSFDLDQFAQPTLDLRGTPADVRRELEEEIDPREVNTTSLGYPDNIMHTLTQLYAPDTLK